jgi:hypothetical protein
MTSPAIPLPPPEIAQTWRAPKTEEKVEKRLQPLEKAKEPGLVGIPGIAKSTPKRAHSRAGRPRSNGTSKLAPKPKKTALPRRRARKDLTG